MSKNRWNPWLSLGACALAAIGICATADAAAPAASPAAPAPAARTAARPAILVFGDSISAGYGIHVEHGWAALLQKRLVDQGEEYAIVNASVSGETTAGGLARLPRALQIHSPAIVILELGGNDGLRALPIAEMRSNLARMLDLIQAAHAQAVLVGMRIPPNYGSAYTTQFHDAFERVAAEHRVPLVPFLLEGVALAANSMQADGIHPNESAQERLLNNVWPKLQPLLRER